MKKKRILLGLAIASAAMFSLAACNNNGGTTTTTTTAAPTTTTTTTAAPTTTTTTTAAPTTTTTVVPTTTTTTAVDPTTTTTTAVDPTTTTTTQQAQEYTATFVAIVDGARDNSLLSKTAQSSNGKFARPTDAEMAKDGYVFQGFYTSATLKNSFDFDAEVDGDTTIYAKYHLVSQYDELNESENKVFATDFSGVTPVVDSNLKFDSTAFTIKTKAEDNVTFNGSAAVLTKDGFIIDLGRKITDPGVYTIYFETTFTGVAGESFAQINGSTNGTDYARVFEIRTGSNKFEYSFDGSNKIASNVAAQKETLYKVLITLDTAEGKVSATVNDEKIADEVVTNISSVNGLKFQAKSDSSTKKTISHVAMTFEEKAASPLVTAKAQALALIDAYIAGDEYAALNASTATAAQKAKLDIIDAQIDASVSAIETSTTVAEVETAQAAWTTFEAASKYVVTVTPYSAAQTAISTLDEYNIAVLGGNTVSLTKMNFDGYIVEGVYTDEALTDPFVATTEITADTQLYAKLRVAQVVSLTYAAASEPANGWTQTGVYNAGLADGEANNSSRPTTGNYDCIRIELKASSSTDTYLQTPEITDATTSVKISMTGFTNGSGDRKNYITATAYNSSNQAIGTVKLYTPDKKQNGECTANADGTGTEVLLNASENISYVKFTCNTDGKGYYVVSATVSYYK